MSINWSYLISALGLAFMIEGIPYFIFSERMPMILLNLVQKGPKQLRILGLIAMILGLLLISLGKSIAEL
ncbi:DUF2065 domain-containing protein [Maridesulfovibrio bastinii]|uniref:DUF2065 domain-containing protein n=1 Tax=Maridesulfovibrio bastinii TaxID=47157 RepID=UPI0004892907|nr:DUF2065 domain-containing protein [Maridesulfovibrio bastinii]